MKIIKKAILFEWDKGNKEKNWIKHKVKIEECEEVFYDDKNIVLPDTKHSQIEKRFYLLGKTKGDRKLTITYTFRIDKIRVISARSQNKKEQKEYANQKIQNNT
jgi:uncharacterized DUF497 family protein